MSISQAVIQTMPFANPHFWIIITHDCNLKPRKLCFFLVEKNYVKQHKCPHANKLTELMCYRGLRIPRPAIKPFHYSLLSVCISQHLGHGSAPVIFDLRSPFLSQWDEASMALGVITFFLMLTNQWLTQLPGPKFISSKGFMAAVILLRVLTITVCLQVGPLTKAPSLLWWSTVWWKSANRYHTVVRMLHS